MKKTIKKLKYLLVAVMCAGLIIACNTSNNNNLNLSETSKENGRISFGTTLKPRTLDPADSYDLAGMNIIYNVGESLYTYELGSTNLTPLLATDLPTVSDDGLVYTIPLREGVKFHDGEVFNAEAMKFSLDRFISNGGKPSFLLGDIVSEVAVTGDYELQITLQQPFSAFPALLAFPGACAISPASYTIGEGAFKPNELVATGAYRLSSFDSDGVKLDVFSDYWGEKPLNEGVDLQIYGDNPANLYNAFLTGAVDVAYQSFAPEQTLDLLAKAQNDGAFQAIEGQGTVITYLAMNLNQAPLTVLPVRQAIASMVSRDLLTSRVAQGLSEPLYTMIPSAFAVSAPVFAQSYPDNNYELAKELLTEAGYSTENPAVIELWYPSTSRPRAGIANTLRALGEQELDGMIKFEPQGVESATAFSNLGKGAYQGFLGDWYPDFLDADNYIHPFLSCSEGNDSTGCTAGGAQNQGSFFYSQSLNDLINQARKTNDSEQLKEIFAQIQTILVENVPYIPLWQTKEYAFAQKNLSGVVINPSQTFPLKNITGVSF